MATMSQEQGLLRLGALAAVLGATAQVLAAVLEPQRNGKVEHDIRLAADSGIWTADRLLDLFGLFLTVLALTIVARTFTEVPGKDWIRLAQPFLIVMGAVGVVAIVTGANLKEIADSWHKAAASEQNGYVASFDGMSDLTDALFFGAFIALALYFGALAKAILLGGVYARWIGWAAAAAAALVLVGDVLVLAFDAAFVALLLGFLLAMIVVVALGVTMWRAATA